jgi:hypothetical protein
LGKKKDFLPLRVLNHDSSTVQHVSHYTDDNILAPNGDDNDDNINNNNNAELYFFILLVVWKNVRKNVKSEFELTTFMLEETTNEVRDFTKEQCGCAYLRERRWLVTS